ncbi:hypothetical protein GTE46_005410 [Salmonella enterica subsp. enterica]|nr:hypothetical protein [Salmonella enterica subsp. enterica]EDY2803860.1 hypothetical protein [Salmonella enterica subsp. enterica]
MAASPAGRRAILRGLPRKLSSNPTGYKPMVESGFPSLSDMRCTGNSGYCHLFFFKQPSDGIFS